MKKIAMLALGLAVSSTGAMAGDWGDSQLYSQATPMNPVSVYYKTKVNSDEIRVAWRCVNEGSETRSCRWATSTTSASRLQQRRLERCPGERATIAGGGEYVFLGEPACQGLGADSLNASAKLDRGLTECEPTIDRHHAGSWRALPCAWGCAWRRAHSSFAASAAKSYTLTCTVRGTTTTGASGDIRGDGVTVHPTPTSHSESVATYRVSTEPKAVVQSAHRHDHQRQRHAAAAAGRTALHRRRARADANDAGVLRRQQHPLPCAGQVQQQRQPQPRRDQR